LFFFVCVENFRRRKKTTRKQATARSSSPTPGRCRAGTNAPRLTCQNRSRPFPLQASSAARSPPRKAGARGFYVFPAGRRALPAVRPQPLVRFRPC
jgi:hypothetical protein